MPALFVSHSSLDHEHTDRIRDWLLAKGYSALFVDNDPQRGIGAGLDWEQELYAQLRSCDGVIFLASLQSVVSPWCIAEVSLARSLRKPVFPVRIHPEAKLPLLDKLQWVDLVDDSGALDRLSEGLLDSGLDPTDAFSWDRKRSPYPGLRPFEAADAAVFFGREDEIDRLQVLLQPTLQQGLGRFVAIVGPSGSGKSSLMRAGVVPRLARRRDWVVLPPLRPDRTPIDRLITCLATAFSARGQDRSESELRAVLKRGSAGLVELGHQLSSIGRDPGQPPPGVLVLIDQTEELLIVAARREQQAFQDLLVGALHREGSPLRVLATMRSEFLSTDPGRSGLAKAISDSLLVEPLSRARLPEVIARPAQRAGVDFESGLVERMAAEASSGDGLPLLAYTLHKLYQEVGRGGTVSIELYTRLGGVIGALQECAAQALAVLERAGLGPLVLPTLLKLVTVDRGLEPSRRVVERRAFTAEENAVVDEFVNAGLLVTDRGERGDRGSFRPATVEVAHEALLRQWAPLRTAIDEARDWLQRRTELDRLVADWEFGRHDESFLLRGGRLAAFLEWAAARPAEVSESGRRFLDACRQLAVRELESTRRSNRRLRALAVGLTMVLVLALVLTAVAWWNYRTAETQTRLAFSRQLAADSDRLVDTEPDLAILAGLHSTEMAAAGLASPPLGLVTALARVTHPSRVLYTHDSQAQAVAYSRDGLLIASGGADGLVRVWDVVTGEPAYPPLTHGGEVWAVSFSPDGGLLVSAGDDGLIRFWDVTTGAERGAPVNHGALVYGISFTSDGALLASGGADGAVRLWRVVDRQPATSQFGNPDGPVIAVAISARGLLAAATEGGTVRLWDAATGTPRGEPLVSSGSMYAVAFSPDGALLAAGGTDSLVRLWDMNTGQPRGGPLARHAGAVRGLAFSPDGLRLASASADRTVGLWSVSTGLPDGQPLVGSTQEVRGVAFNPDGQSLATASWSGEIRSWMMSEQPSVSRTLLAHTAQVQAVKVSPDGAQVATVGVDGAVYRWDMRSGRLLPGPEMRHAVEVNTVDFSADGRMLATASEDGVVKFWDPGTGEAMHDPISTGGLAVRSVAFSPDNQLLALGLADGTVQVRAARTGALRVSSQTPHQGDVYSVSFSPDGTLIASGSTDGTVRLWDPATGDPRSEPIRQLGSVYTVAFSPDGKMLAAGGRDRTVKLWTVIPPGQLRGTLDGHSGEVLSVAFSPDSRLIATGSADHTVRLWDAATGEPHGVVLGGHTDAVTGVQFSPDGAIVVSSSFDNTARLWNPEFDRWTDSSCSLVGRNMSIAEWNSLMPGQEYERTCLAFPPGPGAG